MGLAIVLCASRKAARGCGAKWGWIFSNGLTRVTGVFLNRGIIECRVPWGPAFAEVRHQAPQQVQSQRKMKWQWAFWVLREVFTPGCENPRLTFFLSII